MDLSTIGKQQFDLENKFKPFTGKTVVLPLGKFPFKWSQHGPAMNGQGHYVFLKESCVVTLIISLFLSYQRFYLGR